MKRVITAIAAVSVLGTAGLAAAASHRGNNHGYRGGYSRTTTVRTHARPAVSVRNTHVRTVVRTPARTFVRTPVRTVVRTSYRAPMRTVVRVPVRTRFTWDWSRARVRAARFASFTSNLWARARAYRYWNAHQLSVLSRLEALNLAAQRFMTFGAYVDVAAKQAELARIEAEFATLQTQGAFLSSYGSFSQLASAIAEMRSTLASYAAAQASYTPYANAEPTAPY